MWPCFAGRKEHWNHIKATKSTTPGGTKGGPGDIWLLWCNPSKLDNPQVKCNLQSMSAKPLDSNMAALTEKCLKNEKRFWLGCSGSKLEPLFVLPTERAKYFSVERQTVKELQCHCLELLESIKKFGHHDIYDIYHIKYSNQVKGRKNCSAVFPSIHML